MKIYDIVVIGGGPAGLTAALYGARAGKSVLVMEKNGFGGQITWSPRVDNFPAAGSVSGMEFADRLVEQVMGYGVDMELDEAVSVEMREGRFCVKTAFDCEFEGRSLIVATGAEPRRIGVDGEEEFTGQGVSYCAVCDGEFYKGADVAVVGGGNTALQEAMYLSDICEKVYLIHRREEFRGDDVLAEAAMKRENIVPVLGSRVTGLEGGNVLEAVKVGPAGDGDAAGAKDSGKHRRLAVSGLFVAIGHVPDNDRFSGFMDMSADGYGAAGEDCVTKTPGFFVAGDCRAKNVRQLTTAVADGANAAVEACMYIDGLR